MNVWEMLHQGQKPEPTPKDKQDKPRRWYCPQCDREIMTNLNVVPVNIDGHTGWRVVGVSIPSPCPWCGEPAIKEIAVTEAPPGSESAQTPQPSGLWRPGTPIRQ